MLQKTVDSPDVIYILYNQSMGVAFCKPAKGRMLYTLTHINRGVATADAKVRFKKWEWFKNT